MEQLMRKAVRSTTVTHPEEDELFVNKGETVSECSKESPQLVAISNVQDAYSSSTIENVADLALETSKLFYEDVAKSNVNRTLMMKFMPLDTGHENLLKMWDKQYENG